MSTMTTVISIDADKCKKDGLCTMGHPRLNFNNWVERKPARVTWMQGEAERNNAKPRRRDDDRPEDELPM